MLRVYEFEAFEEDGMISVIPFDFDGATCGTDWKDASEMAADWLKTTIEDYALEKKALPDPTFGNTPEHGGERLLIAIDAGLDSIKRVTAAEAARRLGLTRGRVSKMISSGLLETFQEDGRTWVTLDSVNARLSNNPRPGRPRKSVEA